MKPDERFDKLANEYFNIVLKRSPITATYLGIHKYDHLMPDASRKRILEDIRIEKNFLKRFQNFNPKGLSEDRRIDRELAIHEFNLSLFYSEKLKYWEKDLDIAETIGVAIFPLFVRDFAPVEKRIQNIVSRLKQSKRLIEQVKKRVNKPVTIWTQISIESCETFPIFLKEVLDYAKKRVSKKLFKELEKTIHETIENVQTYQKYLEKLLPKTSKEFAIGPNNFKKLIELREIGLTPNQILNLGKKYLKSSKLALRKAANEIKSGASIEDVKKIVKSRHPKTFEHALEHYKSSIKKAKEFVIKNNFATLPKNEKLLVIQTPSFLRHTTPFAAYFPPAKFDKNQLGTYIVTPPGKHAERMMDHNYSSIGNTSVHEGYPGHHLQLVCANKNKSIMRIFAHATEFVEGWAHYCEEYMKNLGYNNTPATEFVCTSDMIWRATRIIIDVELSTGKMSFDEAVNFLIKNTGMHKEAALAEIKRYTQSPSYQLSYLLGKHLIKQLKDEVKKELAERYSDKLFHDTLLYAGCLPIKYMRRVFGLK
ncbi:MAG: DUF885 domain-containing protein [Candidatus Hodarchaeales archaeon]|jgi:uncharacterized protein (DUF885 family)